MHHNLTSSWPSLMIQSAMLSEIHIEKGYSRAHNIHIPMKEFIWSKLKATHGERLLSTAASKYRRLLSTAVGSYVSSGRLLSIVCYMRSAAMNRHCFISNYISIYLYNVVFISTETPRCQLYASYIFIVEIRSQVTLMFVLKYVNWGFLPAISGYTVNVSSLIYL